MGPCHVDRKAGKVSVIIFCTAFSKEGGWSTGLLRSLDDGIDIIQISKEAFSFIKLSFQFFANIVVAIALLRHALMSSGANATAGPGSNS